MTFEECQNELIAIRRKQGTRCPTLRVDYGGSVFKGRLLRSDSDPEHRQYRHSPYGVLVLEDPGLGRGPQTVLQIASIPSGAIQDLDRD